MEKPVSVALTRGGRPVNDLLALAMPADITRSTLRELTLPHSGMVDAGTPSSISHHLPESTQGGYTSGIMAWADR